MSKFRILNSLNEMLNLILSYNPFLTFQSCRTPSNCNYTFLYLSIMGTLYYMLIYNRLRLSETLPHEMVPKHAFCLFEMQTTPLHPKLHPNYTLQSSDFKVFRSRRCNGVVKLQHLHVKVKKTGPVHNAHFPYHTINSNSAQRGLRLSASAVSPWHKQEVK